MARPKSYGSAAEKQRAYRERKKFERVKTVFSDGTDAEKDLPAVPVLAEPPSHPTRNPEGRSNGGEARESTVENPSLADRRAVSCSDSRGGRQRPSYVPEKEWVLACERAERARRYAAKFPQFVKTSEVVYQDAMWQWENEVRGRFEGVVGGSLSGTRGERI